jgi:3-oxoacyl-[acyl-carrier protein] reductase
MDLGLSGRSAIVCAASEGLGRACARALAGEGVHVTMCARRPELLEQTAETIRRETGSPVTAVPCDLRTEAGRAALLAACPRPDILVTNMEGPSHGDFRDFGMDEWLETMDVSFLIPWFLIVGVVDGMAERRFGRIVNISSRTVKMFVPDLGFSGSARTALTGALAGLSREVARHNVTINQILPGPFMTKRFMNNTAKKAAKLGIDVDQHRASEIAAETAGRVGDPAEFGQACAFLCGAQSGYIVGQNLLMDGGGYPGTF